MLAKVFLVCCCLMAIPSSAESLKNLVLIADGLAVDDPENEQDDYLRLTLLQPSYKQAAQIKVQVEDWLGPGMVELHSASLILVQAPRAPTARVNFIAALLALDITD